MIHPAQDERADALTVPAHRLPVLLDFCGARERRRPGERNPCVFEAASEAAGRAVGAFRVGLGMTIAQAAAAAGVTPSEWVRVERPRKNHIDRAFPVWRVLVWVTAMGGPRFDAGG